MATLLADNTFNTRPPPALVSSRSAVPTFLIRLWVPNLGQLLSVYGADAAEVALLALAERVELALDKRAAVTRRGDGLDVVVSAPPAADDQIGDDIAASDEALAALEKTVCDVALLPVRHCGHRLLASVAIAGEAIDGTPVTANRIVGLARARLDARLRERTWSPPLPAGAHFRKSYVSAMTCAALAYDAIAEDRLFLQWQPIFGEPSGLAILYSEGLVRIADPNRWFDGDPIVAPQAFVPALEQLGLVRGFDAHVVGLTIAKLRADPRARLGCNISAQSAVLDGWWAGLFAVLAAEPALAQRLTLEITETSRIINLAAAIDFARKLRRCGCRIAIDDFGRGKMSIAELVALTPDIVKIDSFFLKRAAEGKGLTALSHLVGLCETIALDVVIEGVDSAEAEARAVAAGAGWRQGQFLANPAIKLLEDHAELFERLGLLRARPAPAVDSGRWGRLAGWSLAATILCGAAIAAGCWWAGLIA